MQKAVVIYTDDFDGKDIPEGEAETIRFGLDGREYEIDLNAKNAQDLRTLFSRFMEAGRRVGRVNGHRSMRHRRNGHRPVPVPAPAPADEPLPEPTPEQLPAPRGRRREQLTDDATKIREAMAARQSLGSPPVAARFSSGTPVEAGAGMGKVDPKVVRSWLNARGIPVGERGRVPTHLVQKWRDES